MDLNFFGKQGSGKGTQAGIIAKKFSYKIFETGGALRSIAQGESDLGLKVKLIMEKGNLVPTEIVMAVVEDFVKKTKKEEKIIFDGIPRSKEQKTYFDQIVKENSRNIKNILIDISDKEALRRLSERKICEDCNKVYGAFYEGEICENCGGRLIKRLDDNPEAIKKRLEIYEKETLPVVNEYKDSDNMIIINGEKNIEEISNDIIENIK